MNTLNEGGKGGLGMLLAVVGCVLGVVGIIVGMQAKNDSKKATDEIANVSQQLGALSSEDQRLGYAIKDLTDQTKAAITALEAKIPKAPPPRTNVVSRTSSGTGAGHSSKPGMYTVKPNDTLGKIAKEHDVTVEAIEKANPGVDSRRLKIGAQIKIP
jgi:LysM repeat protein